MGGWNSILTGSAEVVSLVASILPLVALFQVFDGTTGVTGGILRARGKQVSRYIHRRAPFPTTCSLQVTGAILNLTAYYVLGIPLGLFLTFVHGRGLGGLWEALTVALVYASAVGVWIGVRGVDWKAEVAIAKGRVAGKQ